MAVPRNIEIKAAVRDFQGILAALRPVATESPVRLWQEDTFFPCRDGRLKLRKFSEESGELIYYRRANVAGPKESSYVRVPTSEPSLLRAALEAALGSLGVVRKERIVHKVGRTRIHLDDVEGLGKYVELEVVLADTESSSAGIAESNQLMAQLGIAADQLVDRAYIDLLTASP